MAECAHRGNNKYTFRKPFGLLWVDREALYIQRRLLKTRTWEALKSIFNTSFQLIVKESGLCEVKFNTIMIPKVVYPARFFSHYTAGWATAEWGLRSKLPSIVDDRNINVLFLQSKQNNSFRHHSVQNLKLHFDLNSNVTGCPKRKHKKNSPKAHSGCCYYPPVPQCCAWESIMDK